MTGELTHITKKTTQVKDYKNKAYYAPEILRGNGFSVKGDTFAFGVVCLLFYVHKSSKLQYSNANTIKKRNFT